MKAWLRDPLTFFLIAGAALFFIASWFEPEEIPYDIIISDADMQRLGDQWRMQMRRDASTEELDGLVNQLIKEEIYYREAQRLNLDQNDTIVRRRLVQKLTFLTEDIATAQAPDDQALRAFYEENLERYKLPERYTFTHRYFSADRRADAQQDATTALEDEAATGDPFMLQKAYAERSERDIGDLFGRDFAKDLSTLTPAENWQGPVRSAYGWHAVQLTEVNREAVETFETVRSRVLTDMQQATREAANRDYYDNLKAQYSITLPDATNNLVDAQ